MTGYKPAALMGRLSNGFARDAGTLVHLVPADFGQYQSTGKALCGAKPGRSSGGWDVNHYASGGSGSVTCIRCLSRLEKIESIQPARKADGEVDPYLK